MKQAALLIILFALTTTLPFALANGKRVVDIEGNPVLPGEKYHIVSRLFGVAGGLTFGRIDNISCPDTVIHENLNVSSSHPYGTPVRFNVTQQTHHREVYTGLSLDIEFVNATTKWGAYVVCSPDPALKRISVGVDGQGRCSEFMLRGSFSLEEYEKGVYKILFCDPEGPYSIGCSNTKRVDDKHGIMRLDMSGIYAEPF